MASPRRVGGLWCLVGLWFVGPTCHHLAWSGSLACSAAIFSQGQPIRLPVEKTLAFALDKRGFAFTLVKRGPTAPLAERGRCTPTTTKEGLLDQAQSAELGNRDKRQRALPKGWQEKHSKAQKKERRPNKSKRPNKSRSQQEALVSHRHRGLCWAQAQHSCRRSW